MKLSQFDDIPGADDLARCQHIIDLAEGGVVYVQEKINGVSARAWLADGIIHVMSRTGKMWNSAFFNAQFYDEIRAQLRHMPDGSQLLGELYVPNERLATIAGWINVKSHKANEEFLRRGKFVIWDCITPDARSFGGRMQVLADKWPQDMIYLDWSAVIGVTHADQLEFCYRATLNNKGEGVVYRVDPCFQYEGNSPSPHAWKRTPTHTIEGRCVSVAQGIGKRRGMLGAMYIELADGVVVAVGGGEGLDDEMLTRLYTSPPLGKQVTISYKETSINGTPLRPQLVAVRDYE